MGVDITEFRVYHVPQWLNLFWNFPTMKWYFQWSWLARTIYGASYDVISSWNLNNIRVKWVRRWKAESYWRWWSASDQLWCHTLIDKSGYKIALRVNEMIPDSTVSRTTRQIRFFIGKVPIWDKHIHCTPDVWVGYSLFTLWVPIWHEGSIYMWPSHSMATTGGPAIRCWMGACPILAGWAAHIPRGGTNRDGWGLGPLMWPWYHARHICFGNTCK